MIDSRRQRRDASEPRISLRGLGWLPRRRRVRVALALVVVLPLLALAAFHAAVAWLPYPAGGDRPLAPSTWIVDGAGNPLAAFASADGQWRMPLTIEQISPHLLDAIVATEDFRFYQHSGVDWHAAIAAAAHDVAARGERRGASTLTMQLFRLRQPAPRSLQNKLMQAIHACQIEKQLSKQQILVEYVNRAPFGGNLVGAGPASWRYFGRPCRDLSLGQAALLAGLPQNPNGLRPDRFPARAKRRRDHVLNRMLAAGTITPAQRDLAADEPIDAQWHPLPQFAASASPTLLPMLLDLGRRNPGQTIAVAIDPATQKIAEDLANKTLAALAASHVDSAAVVVLDTRNGQSLANVSLTASADRGYMEDLTACPRSTGSTLKPFIYAEAFDAGICTPSTMLEDSPSAWSGYEPADYDHDFAGPLTAADALAESRNIPALLLLSKVTVPRAVELMNKLGLHTLAHAEKPYGLPLAIGGADATPMELAAAYAALARRAANLRSAGEPARGAGARGNEYAGASGGKRGEQARRLNDVGPMPIDGSALLRPSSALAALQCIADPDRTARVCPSAAAFAPAWKTGTSSGHRDAWCAAVTPGRTVVVWLGNLDDAGSDHLVGADAAAPLALQLLAAIASRQDPSFAPPTGFADAPILASAELTRDADQLILLSPAPDQQIILDPSQPANSQQLALRARLTSGSADTIYWFIDGKSVGQGPAGQTLWWPPTPGAHESAPSAKPNRHGRRLSSGE